MTEKILDNRYEILEQVGGGGMALVYRARDIYLNRIVAIKILREQLTSDEEFVSRFRREAQAVASLSHTNIVSIYDVGHSGQTYYLVMEMVEGRNLKELIKENGPFPIDKAIAIAKQICDALEHAHEHQIIHRDIKPHNIIITKDGVVKVTDFGIARAVSTATVTHSGNIMGSVHYFSPEQARGEIADERSDIYSLGVVIYEMLTGELPFVGESPISVALKKIQNDPLSPRKINSQIGEALEKVILIAMDKDPKKRFKSADDLRANLLSAHVHNRLDKNVPEKVSEDTVILPRLPKEGTDQRGEKTPKANAHATANAPFKLWVWIILALMVIGFVLGMYLSANVLAREEVTVPDVRQKTVTEAQEELDGTGLFLEVNKTVAHPTVAKGLIISQTPKVDEIVRKSTKILVTVSDGPQMVDVPNVVDSSASAAEIALTNKGLESTITRVYNSQVPEGNVIDQEPDAGKEVAQGTAVALIVSKGPEPVWIKMPKVTGYTLTEAKEILKQNNLTLEVVQPEVSYIYEEEIVIRQDPGPDSEVLQGAVVNLVVSAGPGPFGE
ncbi:MAG: Stk1 family PASTA domain-containing Ser/Thr kinase [Peptococcia bacterium]